MIIIGLFVALWVAGVLGIVGFIAWCLFHEGVFSHDPYD